MNEPVDRPSGAIITKVSALRKRFRALMQYRNIKALTLLLAFLAIVWPFISATFVSALSDFTLPSLSHWFIHLVWPPLRISLFAFAAFLILALSGVKSTEVPPGSVMPRFSLLRWINIGYMIWLLAFGPLINAGSDPDVDLDTVTITDSVYVSDLVFIGNFIAIGIVGWAIFERIIIPVLDKTARSLSFLFTRRRAVSKASTVYATLVVLSAGAIVWTYNWHLGRGDTLAVLALLIMSGLAFHGRSTIGKPRSGIGSLYHAPTFLLIAYLCVYAVTWRSYLDEFEYTFVFDVINFLTFYRDTTVDLLVEHAVLVGLAFLFLSLYRLSRQQTTKVSPVGPASESSNPAELSIHPSTNVYVDGDGYAKDLSRIIGESNGGVVGVTGVRGAGKSALLKETERRFQSTHLVVWMTAPASHKSSDNLSFLISMGRSVSEKTIAMIETALYPREEGDGDAFDKLWRRFRPAAWAMLVFSATVILIGSWLIESQPQPTATANVAFPDDAEIVMEIRNSAAQGSRSIEDTFDKLVQIELDTTRSLLEEINTNRDADPVEVTADGPFAFVPLLSSTTIAISPKRISVENQAANLDGFLKRLSLKGWSSLPGFPTSDQISDYLSEPREKLLCLVGDAPGFKLEECQTAYRILIEHPEIGGKIKQRANQLKTYLGMDPADERFNDLLPGDVLREHYFLELGLNSGPITGPETTPGLDEKELSRLKSPLTQYQSLLSPPVSVASEDADPGPDLATYGLIFFLVLIASIVLYLVPELRRGSMDLARSIANRRYFSLMREANDFLEFLEYKEERERGGTLSFKWLGFSRKQSFTARALTLQSLTDRYHAFVDLVLPHFNDKLIVIVDELDKMTDPNDVKLILRELKSAFFKDGTYYLLSISEDAARKFQGRLSEGRDIFESTFEEVFNIEGISPETARSMLEERTGDSDFSDRIEPKAIDVLTMFSGAIPREIIRYARDLLLRGDEGSFTAMETGKAVMELELRRWHRELLTAPFEAETLLALRSHCAQIIERLKVSSEGDDFRFISAKLSESFDLFEIEKLGSEAQQVRWQSSHDDDASYPLVYRRLAEAQTCLRLMVMAEVMRYLSASHGETRFAPNIQEGVIACIRTVFQNPSIAYDVLERTAQNTLNLEFPVTNAPVAEAHAHVK